MQTKLSRLQKQVLSTLFLYRKKPFELTRRGLSKKVAIKVKKGHSDPSFQVSLCNSLKSLEKRRLIESVHWGEYRSYVQLTNRGKRTIKEIKSQRKNILLVDIDSKMPNIALMKISSYHKMQGDKVSLIRHPCVTGNEIIPHEFDTVYISSIFEENTEKTIQFSKQFRNVELGGYYIDSKKMLPYQIEHLLPDYTIYKCNYSIGYTSRGCFRDCPWCNVSDKEGDLRATNDIYEFWNPKHKHIEILDNNILGLPEHFKKIAGQILKENLSVSFHGLDARLLNDGNTELLSRLNIKPEPRFAFDTPSAEKSVINAIKLLNKHGIKRALWYVLVGFNTTWEEDMHRVMLLKKYEQRPFVMRYKTVKDPEHRDYHKYTLFASWVNQYRFFSSMNLKKFIECNNDRSKLKKRTS